MKTLTTIFTAILMTLVVTAFAADGKKVYEGQVVLENGETITGQIEMLSPTLNEVKVKVITNGQAKIYKAKEVASYSFTFKKYSGKTKTYNTTTIEYVKRTLDVAPVPFGTKDALVERQVEGTVSLYNFYAETRASAHGFAHNYYVENDGQMIAVNRDNFKTVLKDIVADYPELKAKVGKKGYGYAHVAKIITEYNEFKTPVNDAFPF
jgi:hypothetical protein